METAVVLHAGKVTVQAVAVIGPENNVDPMSFVILVVFATRQELARSKVLHRLHRRIEARTSGETGQHGRFSGVSGRASHMGLLARALVAGATPAAPTLAEFQDALPALAAGDSLEQKFMPDPQKILEYNNYLGDYEDTTVDQTREFNAHLQVLDVTDENPDGLSSRLPDPDLP